MEKFQLAEKVKHFQWRTFIVSHTHTHTSTKTKENELQFEVDLISKNINMFLRRSYVVLFDANLTMA